MKKPFLRTVSSTMQQKEKVKKIKDESLSTAISQIEQTYGKGSIMKLGDNKKNKKILFKNKINIKTNQKKI